MAYATKGELDQFAYKLKKLRDERKASQEEFAELMGISLTHYKRLENAGHEPTLFYLARFAKDVGVSLSYFVDHIEGNIEKADRLWKEYENQMHVQGKKKILDSKQKRKVLEALNLWNKS